MGRLGLQIALIALGTVLVIGLIGCSAAAPSLDGTSWTLADWSADTGKATEFEVTLEFKDGELGGRAPVNSYGGSYELTDGGSFKTGDINRTLMAGSPEADAAETTYFELFNKVERYTVDGSTLTLRDADGTQLLVFTAAE